MIKYSSEFYGLGLKTGVSCYMLDLYNAFGAISSRTLFCAPEGDHDIQIWIFGSVVAIPDIGLSFRKPSNCTPAGIESIIRRYSGSCASLSTALAATVAVMDRVVERECEFFDTNTNLADIVGIEIDMLFPEFFDEMPF